MRSGRSPVPAPGGRRHQRLLRHRPQPVVRNAGAARDRHERSWPRTTKPSWSTWCSTALREALRRLRFRDAAVALGAEPADRPFHDVAGLEEDAEGRAVAVRRAGADHVARLELDPVGQVGDLALDAGHHVARCSRPGRPCR